MRFFVGLFLVCCAASAQTALDEYVHTPDPAYRYDFEKSVDGDGVRLDVLRMVSQRWLTEAEVDKPEWWHWVNVYRPETVESPFALLFISGGDTDDGPPSKVNAQFGDLAKLTKSIVVELRMVPNQPLVFEGDDFGPRYEDEIISLNWRTFLDTGDTKWLTRLPMTKSAVRAMDTIQDYFLEKERLSINGFVVAGGSKRGWTTWTTAAVDSRVIGIIPIVIDLLNIKPSFVHHYRVYGFWAPAVGDYFREGIMDRQEDPRYAELLSITGPYAYRDRYTMPKFVLNSAGDQFFLPDSAQFYADDLPGELNFRYVPNSDHSLKDTNAWESLAAYYNAMIYGIDRPEVSWEWEGDGTVRVKSNMTPVNARLWTATNPRHRDFRLESVGEIYESRELTIDSGNIVTATVEEPGEGFTAYFVELEFESGMRFPFTVTTPVKVTPDRYPFGEPVAGETKIGPKKQ